MTTRDTRRAFTQTQQKAIWKQQDSRCAICHKKLDITIVQYHHIKGWAAQGGTVTKNGAALCPICHGLKTHGERLKKVDRKVRIFSSAKKDISSMKKKVNTTDEPVKTKRERKAELDIKVRKWVSSLGYQVLINELVLDLYAKKEATLIESSKYLGCGLNLEDSLSKKYVSDFLTKIERFYEKVNGSALLSLDSADFQGIIAYTGELPKEVSSLVKGHKPGVKFKKV